MGIWSIRRLLSAAAVAVLVAGLFANPGLAQDENAVKDLFRKGIAAYDEGKYPEAYEAFESALRMNPSSDLILYLRDEAGDARLHQMLVQGGDLAQTASRIMELAKGVLDRVRRSPEEIQGFVKKLESQAFDERWEGILNLVQAGQLACPPLIELLKDQTSDDLRTSVIVTLTRMHDDAVPALIEALDSTSAFQRQNAAIVLGNIKDWRGAAGLKRLLEDGNQTPEVQQYAAEALTKITGSGQSAWPSAKELYFQLAEKYYLNHPQVMRKYYQDYIVFKWDAKEDKLTWKEVPAFQLNERYAQEACFDAIALDPNYEPIWPLLSCTYFAMHHEGSIALKTMEANVKAGTSVAEDQEKLKVSLANLERAWLFGPLVGKQNLYRALERSMNDDRPEVAVAAIKALRTAGTGEELPNPVAGDTGSVASSTDGDPAHFGYPLVRALLHDDKRVRYAAAEALISINPKAPFLGSNRVVPVLAEALQEMRVRTVLVIEPDPEVRNKLREAITKLGYFPVVAATGAEGIHKAKAFPAEDAIVIDFKTAGKVIFTATAINQKVTETVMDTLKLDPRTRGIPVLILSAAEEAESAKNIYKEEPKAYLSKNATYLAEQADLDGLKNALEGVFSSPEAQADAKAQAENVVIAAAAALANLDPNSPVFDRVEAVEALVGNTSNRPDNIKVAALQALSRIGDPAAIEPLAKVYENAENAKDVRVAAGHALAGIFKTSHAVAADPVYQTLKAGLLGDDIDLSNAAATALGNAALTPEQSRELAEARRY